MDMIGTAFVPERAHFAKTVPNSHFQFGMPWGKHADATEVLRDAMAAMQAGAQLIYCGMSPQRRGFGPRRRARDLPRWIGSTESHMDRWLSRCSPHARSGQDGLATGARV